MKDYCFAPVTFQDFPGRCNLCPKTCCNRTAVLHHYNMSLFLAVKEDETSENWTLSVVYKTTLRADLNIHVGNQRNQSQYSHLYSYKGVFFVDETMADDAEESAAGVSSVCICGKKSNGKRANCIKGEGKSRCSRVIRGASCTRKCRCRTFQNKETSKKRKRNTKVKRVSLRND